jgi:multiple sugar transport system permease protein
VTADVLPTKKRADASSGRPASRRHKLVAYTALTIVGIVTAFPFYAMIMVSLNGSPTIQFPDVLLPFDLSLDNYRRISGGGGVRIVRWTFNTLVYSVVSVALVLLFASMAGFAFAKKRFPGRDTIFWSLIATLMVPVHVALIPLFVIIARLGGVNTYWGMIVPTLANAQAVFLMRQFIMGLPDELLEAARSDGASEFRVYWNIILPLTTPVLATLGIFVFLWHWNDFLWPLLIAQSDGMRTLTVGLAAMQMEAAPLGIVMAGATVSFIPAFLVFVVLQKHFVQGVTMSGIKG